MIETATAYFAAGETCPSAFWVSVAALVAGGLGLLAAVVG